MELFIGVDVGKNQLDVYYHNNSMKFDNTKLGIKKLISHFKSLEKKKNKISLIICEATGGYERLMTKSLHKASLPIHVAHANKIRYFAKTKGLLAKTDKVDAILISDYGRIMNIQKDEIISTENEEKLGKLMKRREQLMINKQSEENRLETEDFSDINRSINVHVNWIKREILKIEKNIEDLSREKEIYTKLSLLTSIPGVGKITALSLIAFMPELGNINHRQVAALAGVAPFNRDSGRLKGSRRIQGGRAVVRRAMYMSAISSITWNPSIKIFYDRLRAKGKPGKVALVAVMRKLLITVNTVLERGTNWVPEYGNNA